MNAATAVDHAWIRTSDVFRLGLQVGYMMTLVRGVSPEQVLRVMGAEPVGVCTGADELDRKNAELRPEDYWDESFVAGVCTVPGDEGDWSLVLHFDGGVGMRPRFLKALSAGSRAVVHSSNGGKPLHFFDWYEDGELRTHFEWANSRSGSTPDALLPVMRSVGCDVDGTAESDVYDRKAAVLALAERMTGVRITDELLRTTGYQLGHVPDEPAPAWGSVVIDITDAGGKRFRKEVTREQVDRSVRHRHARGNRPIRVDTPPTETPSRKNS